MQIQNFFKCFVSVVLKRYLQYLCSLFESFWLSGNESVLVVPSFLTLHTQLETTYILHTCNNVFNNVFKLTADFNCNPYAYVQQYNLNWLKHSPFK